jgi:biotin transporter BioY
MLAQFAAVVAAPAGRRELLAQLGAAGVPAGSRQTVLVLDAALLLLAFAMGAGLHGLAYYGLRARRRWGWVSAVLAAGLWSLALVGIPVLRILLRRETRAAFPVE